MHYLIIGMFGIGAQELFLLFIIFLLGVIPISSYWKLFEKAGEDGSAAILPFYGTIIQLRIVEKPWWWLILMFIPYVGLIWYVWMINLFVKKFGKSEIWTIGCIFLPFIFLPILAFSNEIKYSGSHNTNLINKLNSDLLDQI